jgi:hypothetical protein
MMVVWIVGTLTLLAAGAWAQDRRPWSIVARMVALAGGCWFAGAWLALFLLS